MNVSKTKFLVCHWLGQCEFLRENISIFDLLFLRKEQVIDYFSRL